VSVTIGCVANVYNEINALPGWLESATSFFDDVQIFHAGPGGAKSNDGTLELLERWKIPVTFGSIDEGFGAIRTKAIRISPCDFVCILDADERFHRYLPMMTCSGESTPHEEVDRLLYDYGDPNYKDPGQQEYDKSIFFTAVPSNFENMSKLGAKLNVKCGETFNQGGYLRYILESSELDAVRTVRRHWHDFSGKRPTQNWHTEADFQTRIVRNHESIYFDAGVRMHERLQGAKNVFQPDFTRGPFFDHYHLFFKRQEALQRGHDIAIYNAIDKGLTPPTWEEFSKKL
jgi:hypothetical protein